MDLDSFLVSLYVTVDDWWRARHASIPRRPGRPALLADSEVLTLAILAQWPRFRSERDFWRFVAKADRRWASFARKAPDHRGGDLPALKDFFGLERHCANTLGGLLARLAAKIAAYFRRRPDASGARISTPRI